MIEVAVVIDKNGIPIFWPSNKGAEGCYIPDSSILWDRIWENRHIIGGIAHTHPWCGVPLPSMMDATTWSAIERALGKQLLWPIISMDRIVFYAYYRPGYGMLGYVEESLGSLIPFRDETHWLKTVIKLRQMSAGDLNGNE